MKKIHTFLLTVIALLIACTLLYVININEEAKKIEYNKNIYAQIEIIDENIERANKSLSTHLKCIEMQNYYVENNLKSKSDADETIHTMELGIKVIQNTLRNENDKKTNLLNSLK